MLVYNPTLDPYHAAIRILAILEPEPNRLIAIDAARIAEFYLAYPSKVGAIRLPNEFRDIRKVSKQSETPYRNPFDIKATFQRMHPIFMASVSTLAAAGYISHESIKQDYLQRTDLELPEDLKNAVTQYLSRNDAIKTFIINKLTSIKLLGVDGLKHRTTLLEHRYDLAT